MSWTDVSGEVFVLDGTEKAISRRQRISSMKPPTDYEIVMQVLGLSTGASDGANNADPKNTNLSKLREKIKQILDDTGPKRESEPITTQESKENLTNLLNQYNDLSNKQSNVAESKDLSSTSEIENQEKKKKKKKKLTIGRIVDALAFPEKRCSCTPKSKRFEEPESYEISSRHIFVNVDEEVRESHPNSLDEAKDDDDKTKTVEKELIGTEAREIDHQLNETKNIQLAFEDVNVTLENILSCIAFPENQCLGIMNSSRNLEMDVSIASIDAQGAKEAREPDNSELAPGSEIENSGSESSTNQMHCDNQYGINRNQSLVSDASSVSAISSAAELGCSGPTSSIEMPMKTAKKLANFFNK